MRARRNVIDSPDEFWANVQRAEGDACWPWTGRQGRLGYGRVIYQGRHRVATRIAYELTYGPNSAPFMCHRCDNPACVNPAHIFPGSAADNNTDRARKGRSNRKLTPDDVRRIRDLRADKLSYRAIARMFGVTDRAVRLVLAGQTHRFV